MASIQRIVGYGGTIEKRTASSGVVYVVRVTDGPESPPFPKRSRAVKWLHKHAKVVSTHYRAQIRMRGRRSESQNFPNEKEAKTWVASIESAIREARHYPHAAAKRTTFDALVKDYTESVLGEFGAKERATRTRHLRWWSEQFRRLTVAEITPERIGKARDVLASQAYTKGKAHTNKRTGEVTPPKEYKRSGATVNRHLATLSHVLSFAVRERQLLSGNPVGAIPRKKESRGRTRFLSDAERTALLDACERSAWSGLRALVLLAITTGARKGELLSLQWSDVDLKAGRALVRESKNDEQRTLPLVGKALEAVRELKLKNSARSAYLFPAPTVVLNTETGKPELDGPFLHFDSHWHAALDAAGIEGFRFHDLRHTAASMLAANGASLLEIADVLGHKTLAMVKRYSHLVADHKHALIERLAAAKGL